MVGGVEQVGVQILFCVFSHGSQTAVCEPEEPTKTPIWEGLRYSHQGPDAPSSLKGIKDRPQDVCAGSKRKGICSRPFPTRPAPGLSLSLEEYSEAVPPRENNSPRCLGRGRGLRRRLRLDHLRSRPRDASPAPFRLTDLSPQGVKREVGSVPDVSAVAGVRLCQGGEEMGHGCFYFFFNLPFATVLILVTIPTDSHASLFLETSTTSPPPQRSQRGSQAPSSFALGHAPGGRVRGGCPAQPYGSCSSFFSPKVCGDRRKDYDSQQLCTLLFLQGKRSRLRLFLTNTPCTCQLLGVLLSWA